MKIPVSGDAIDHIVSELKILLQDMRQVLMGRDDPPGA